MTTKKEPKYILFNDDTYNTVVSVHDTVESLLKGVEDIVLEGYHKEEDLQVYELGRKGVLPKRTIQFI